MRLALIFLLAFAANLPAQLVLTGPVPKAANPPVVFLNGYEPSCPSDFQSTFFTADKLLQANGTVSLFFDNCAVGSGKPSIEALGAAFGQFLNALKYTDGSKVSQVDIVAHSLGGLIVRSYLAGKQDVTPAVFNPPADPLIRKIIFLATPHFGTTTAVLASDKQSQELVPGSQFLFDLNTWNQGTEDLRGIPAISISGNGGTGNESGFPGFDDGVVTLTSSTLNFYKPGLTRVLPDCHTYTSLLVTFQYCLASTPVITEINTDPANPVSKAIVSFLNGTTAWQSVGVPVDQTQAAGAAGVILQLRDKDDQTLSITGATVTTKGAPVSLFGNGRLAYHEALDASAPSTVVVSAAGGVSQTATIALPKGSALAAIVKPGPSINPKGVIPAVTQLPFPYDVAPGSFVAIYGSNLASTNKVQIQPYPNQVDDLQVLVNGTAVPIQFAGQNQINVIYPTNAGGLTQLTVKNSMGKETINVRVAPSVPGIFEIGNGAGAAVNAISGALVGPSSPLHAGDFVSLYLTGLGITDNRGGLDYARVQPAITVGGADCPVAYAGRNPTYAALDQINCKIPAGITGAAVPVVVTSNGRNSGTVTLNIQ